MQLARGCYSSEVDLDRNRAKRNGKVSLTFLRPLQLQSQATLNYQSLQVRTCNIYSYRASWAKDKRKEGEAFWHQVAVRQRASRRILTSSDSLVCLQGNNQQVQRLQMRQSCISSPSSMLNSTAVHVVSSEHTAAVHCDMSQTRGSRSHPEHLSLPVPPRHCLGLKQRLCPSFSSSSSFCYRKLHLGSLYGLPPQTLAA